MVNSGLLRRTPFLWISTMIMMCMRAIALCAHNVYSANMTTRLHLSDAYSIWKVEFYSVYFCRPITYYLPLLFFQFALVETVTTSIFDQWPQTRKRKWQVILVVSIIGFVLGLTMCTSVSKQQTLWWSRPRWSLRELVVLWRHKTVTCIMTSQTVSSAMTSQTVCSAMTSQPVSSAMTSQTVSSAMTSQRVSSAMTSQTVSSAMTSQTVSSAMTSQTV